MGQIRIGVYDSDAGYTERFCQYMNEASENAEFLPLYEKDQMESLLASRETEAVLIPEEMREDYPPFIGEIHVGYLTEEPGGEPGEVFRYQDRRSMLQDVERLLAQEDTSVKLLAFLGAGTGTGCSAAASAYAQYLAAGEKQVLYLNMNSLGDDSCIFRGGNPKDLRFLLQEMAKEGTPAGAMPAMLNRAPNGVYFYDNETAPLGLMDVGEEEMYAFFRGLIDSGEYRYIIVDSSFSVNHGLMAACRAAEKIFLVGDGTHSSNHLLDRIWKLFGSLDEGLLKKTAVLYNRFHKQYGRFYENPEAPAAGCLELAAPAGAAQIVEMLSEQKALREILR